MWSYLILSIHNIWYIYILYDILFTSFIRVVLYSYFKNGWDWKHNSQNGRSVGIRMRFIACCRDTMYQMDIAYVPLKTRGRGPTRLTHGFMVDIYIYICVCVSTINIYICPPYIYMCVCPPYIYIFMSTIYMYVYISTIYIYIYMSTINIHTYIYICPP
jgi:hypothetical protein